MSMLAAMSVQAEVQLAQNTVETDCTEVDIDYQNSNLLTHEERIAAMDRALNRSLNKYDGCVTEKANQSGSGGGSEGGSGEGGSGEGDAGQGQSTEASGISGTNTPPPIPAQQTTPNTAEAENSETPENQTGQLSNGKIPEDIPAANNDDILAQRIRSAAENETDPEKQARLWNEYRKYKGLPQK